MNQATAEYESRAEQFTRAIIREYYRVGAGHKDRLQVAKIYEEFAELFSREAVTTRLSAADDKAGRHLAWFAVDGYISDKLKALTEAITNAELEATVEWDGEEISYQNLRQYIANEPDWRRRHQLEEAMYDVMAGINEQRAEAIRRQHALARTLDFETYTTMIEELKHLDLAALADQMRHLLKATEARYSVLLGAFLATVDVPREEATTADITYLARAHEFDDIFPAAALVPTLEQTLGELGLPLNGGRAPTLDVEVRPLKSPRAFCAPVVVPDEVYLVIKPVGGQDDYQSLFHEAGHAEHFSWVDPALRFAFRYLGDDAVSETYAFLFEHVTHSVEWLKTHLDVTAKRAQEYRRFALFLKLWFLRRYAAKLLYELEHLHAGDPDAAEAYERLLHGALKVKIDSRRYLEDVDEAYYVAGYLRAWIFEMQLREHLVEAYGLEWWRVPEAGARLKELWRIGIRESGEELAGSLGYEGLDVRPLLDEVLETP